MDKTQRTEGRGKGKGVSAVSTETDFGGTYMPHLGATSLSEGSRSSKLHLMRKSNNISHLHSQHVIRGSMWQTPFKALHI